MEGEGESGMEGSLERGWRKEWIRGKGQKRYRMKQSGGKKSEIRWGKSD